jgi:SAM-dependent methyltransferase
MGIPDTCAARLIETVHENGISGDMVMLGRQRWTGPRRKQSAKLLRQSVKKFLPETQVEDLANPDNHYSEVFFKALGFSSIDSMDISDFEDATIIQNLGEPLAPDLHERFDMVYDGGTCEHVFDLPAAYRNIDKMLRPGGVFIAHSPCNNWTNHGFYQIGPEVVYGFWANALGYEVLQCELQGFHPAVSQEPIKMTDPNVTGRRPRPIGTMPNGRIILNYAVRKPMSPMTNPGKALQTDYVQRWSEAGDDAASDRER